MFAFLTHSLLGLASTASASSSALERRCDAATENVPWHLTALTSFNATPASGCESYICFNFCAFNATDGLALVETECRLYVNGSLPSFDESYHFCENDTVQFSLTDVGIDVAKSDVDTCVGTAPSYEVDFFGHGDTQWTTTSETDGVYSTMTELWVPAGTSGP